MRNAFLLAFLLVSICSYGQKKVLDHSVYDGWENIAETKLTPDGRYIVYTVRPQEGDGTLYIQTADKSYTKAIPRGHNIEISGDSRYLVCQIAPFYKDTREARIKKKKSDDMPQDTLAIIELGKDSIIKIPRVKTFRLPEKGNTSWLAYHRLKALPEKVKKEQPDSATQINRLLAMADSLAHVADSLRQKVSLAEEQGLAVLRKQKDSTQKPPASKPEPFTEGTELVLRNLLTGKEIVYPLVNGYFFSEKGKVLMLQTTRSKEDTLVQAAILWVDTEKGSVDTVMQGLHDTKNYAFDEAELQLAFLAERDSSSKALQKFYKLWYYRPGMDSARLRAWQGAPGVPAGMEIGEYETPEFSKDGKKLFFGLSPVRPVKDTTLVDFETSRLDIWHYNDDYLQPQQLKQLTRELHSSYLAVLNGDAGQVIPLGATDAENTYLVDKGNADYVLATSTNGNRIAAQWQGFSLQTAYIISTKDGHRTLIKKDIHTFFRISPGGKYVIWYDPAFMNYFTYEVSTGKVREVTTKITEPLYDDEDDHPTEPREFGIATWLANDAAVLIEDRYDLWQVDPAGRKAPVNITGGYGKAHHTELKYLRTDPDERFVKPDAVLLLTAFNRTTKEDGFCEKKLGKAGAPVVLSTGPYSFGRPDKARDAAAYAVSRMTIKDYDLYSTSDFKHFTRLSVINPQQEEYNWLTVELTKWTMFDGKESEGLLFKPENFDSTKKYPVLFYFYEKNADGLYRYRPPAPSASTINIPYFVSNGYIVFDPNIFYKDGEPGESAYNAVVSAAKYLSQFPWVDSTKMGIQGQSWGGYQVAYLVTRTNLFAAAGAGAPVANMTSAYGGIRWGTGLNRQFQYERTQSRIGATLWERPDLYIKNSPLFHADKVETPLLIMHNDDDGSVPWYQGIEYFTALRRLGKQVWMLEYNGEDHNLVQRRNRKDLSIRLAQFFDHFLKGAPAPVWIEKGVPATLKGIDWGLEVEE